MKKLLCILLMLLCTLPALAESPFAPYTLTLPEGAALQENEGTYTCVAGNTRAVVQTIPRVPDADPAAALQRMMHQFEPAALLGDAIPLVEGFHGLRAHTPDCFGPGVGLHTAMILAQDGALLILSAYDMDGQSALAEALLDQLIASLTVQGAPIYLPDA